MSRWKANLPNLTIASGASVSSSTPSGALDDAVVVAIYAPATLTTNCSIQVSVDGSTWDIAQSGNTDVTISQGRTTFLQVGAAEFLRVSNVAVSEATARTFQIVKQFDVST